MPHLNRQRWILVAAIGSQLAYPLVAAQPVDFDTEIMPIFTKAGCNTGACHGAAVGRGGFRLSLYGSDAMFDHRSIVSDLEGRRINLAEPNRSLLLRKSTETIEHGGGARLDLDGQAVERLRQWIREGANRQTTYRLVELTVSPTAYVAHMHETVLLRASASFSDATQADVTIWTVFSAEDPTAVEIDDAGRATLRRQGRHLVIARYLDRVLPIELIVPWDDSVAEAELKLGRDESQFIDGLVDAKIATLGLQPAATVTDQAFLRRVKLDLIGRLPTVEEVALLGQQSAPLDRNLLVDELLQSSEFVDYWTWQIASLLRIRPRPEDHTGALTYHHWLREQIRTATPYDQLVRQLLLSTGDTHEVGPANFYRTVRGPREQAELTSELFMGSRLRCANCHNHPLDRWTQDDYHGLAAIFARIQQDRVITESVRGDVSNPRTGEPAIPRIPGERYLNISDGRKALANWLTDVSNPYFAKAIVNRLWKSVMGRGLVEPTDDMRPTNPATHPILLQRLAEDFVQHNYDLRHTLRRIVTSQAYARGRLAGSTHGDNVRFFAQAHVRPLPAEVLADAISDVTGIVDRYGDTPAGTRAIHLVDPTVKSDALDLLGRCSREETCETPTPTGGLPLKLHVLNGDLVNRKLADSDGYLALALKSRRSTSEIVNEFYVRALSRQPRPEESEFWRAALDVNLADRTGAFEDFLWSLIACREFQTNH